MLVMSRVVGVIGASGYIGSRLCAEMEREGWRVIRISRMVREVKGQVWKVLNSDCVQGLDALVNLSGERIDRRWTTENRRLFRGSREGLTGLVSAWIGELAECERPGVWLNASAVGFYGDRGDERLTEDAKVGQGFLADLCADWERACGLDGLSGVRVVHPRIGVVLGRDSPAWGKLGSVFKVGLGGRLGGGQFWFPWIHVDDVVQAFIFCIVSSGVKGPVNLVAPRAVRNVDFTRLLSRYLGVPAKIDIPRSFVTGILGGFGDALLCSQRVSPMILGHSRDFVFKFNSVDQAFRDFSE